MTIQLTLFKIPALRYGDPHCVDCDVRTTDAGEYYMVHDDVWPLDKRGGMLCVGCLEDRIGRRLTPADFIDVPVNHGWASARLRSRQGREEVNT